MLGNCVVIIDVVVAAVVVATVVVDTVVVLQMLLILLRMMDVVFSDENLHGTSLLQYWTGSWFCSFLC